MTHAEDTCHMASDTDPHMCIGTQPRMESKLRTDKHKQCSGKHGPNDTLCRWRLTFVIERWDQSFQEFVILHSYNSEGIDQSMSISGTF